MKDILIKMVTVQMRQVSSNKSEYIGSDAGGGQGALMTVAQVTLVADKGR